MAEWMTPKEVDAELERIERRIYFLKGAAKDALMDPARERELGKGVNELKRRASELVLAKGCLRRCRYLQREFNFIEGVLRRREEPEEGAERV